MPYKGDGKQFSVRLPKEYVRFMEDEARRQHHGSKNAVLIQLLEKAIGEDVLGEVRQQIDAEERDDYDDEIKDQAT
jgi:Arc/MetJ-type ribon-helix-helix transcriptional regulator